MVPTVISPTLPGALHPPTFTTDQQQTPATYSNAYSTYTYNPYAADSYMNAAKSRSTPYSRNMEYAAYHPRMNGLYPRSNLGYPGYEAR